MSLGSQHYLLCFPQTICCNWDEYSLPRDGFDQANIPMMVANDMLRHLIKVQKDFWFNGKIEQRS